MNFQTFGVRSFVPETRVADFVARLAQGQVAASRCRDCGRTAFPPRSRCPACGSDAFDWRDIDEVGRLLTYTRVMYGPAGFEAETPYTLAVAEFPMGVRVFGQLAVDIGADEVAVGMPVKAAPRPLADGRYSFQFIRP